MNIQNIPKELKRHRQFVVWRFEERKGKTTKVPYNPRTDTLASSTDPDTWGDIDDALSAMATGTYDGIGFVFHRLSGITGIDLDHVLDNGNLTDFAQQLVNRFKSYTEISPSGTGLHILVRGEIAGRGIHRSDIEIYDQGRFFTMTGEVYGGLDTIRDGGKALAELYSTYDAARPNGSAGTNVIPLRDETTSQSADVIELFCEDDYAEGLWEKTVPHKSQSEYDLAIASCALHRGISRGDIAHLIYKHREKWGQDPAKARRPDYIAQTLEVATKGSFQKDMELQAAIGKSQFLIDAADIISKPKKLNWLIKGYVPAGGIIWLAGEWSTKKTFLALHECIHIALGLPWCGQVVKQGNVVYVTGEGFLGIGKRLKALEMMIGVDVPPGCIRFTQNAVMLNDSAEFRNLVFRIRQEFPACAAIFIDTKSANMQGSDSDPAEMNKWVNTARRLEREFNCAIVVVDHVGHLAKDRPRGASQQMGAADAVYMVECDKETNPMLITLRTEKDPKDFQAPPALQFNAEVVTLPEAFNDEDGTPSTSLVLVQRPNAPVIEYRPPEDAGLGKASKSALQVLRDMYAQYRQNLIASECDPSAAKVEFSHWRGECLELGIKPSTFASIPEALVSRGFIEIDCNLKHVYLIEGKQ